MATKPVLLPTEPLQTRHVFLDTEVYRRAGFNLSNSQFALLRKLVSEGRISMHTTDITLAEIRRQLSEEVGEKVAELTRLARDFRRLDQITGGPPLSILVPHTVTYSQSAWSGFLDGLLIGLHAHSVGATQVMARLVFEDYFNGKPPFSKRGSKEFPDAFVLRALAKFCAENSVKMYVVTGDRVMRDAAAQTENLLPLETIDDVLAAAAQVDAFPGLETLVEQVFDWPGFDQQLEDAIGADMIFLDLVYYGPLTDGLAREPELAEIIEVEDYKLVAHDGDKLGLIVEVTCFVRATVEYLDADELREKDDDVLPTRLTTSTRVQARLSVFLSVDLKTMAFNESELLTKELLIE